MTNAIPTPTDIMRLGARARTGKLPERTAPITKTVPELRHRRGEIWMVATDPAHPAIGTELWSNRPAVIVTNNVLNGRSGFAQVVYLSTSIRKRTGPTHVLLPAYGGHGEVMALCEQIHTVDASRLRQKLGTVPEDCIRDLDTAMSLALSIGRNPNTHSAFRKWEEHVKIHGIDMAEEIRALSGKTTDERVESLARALELVTIERDSFRNLYETAQERPSVLRDVAKALDRLPVR